MIFAMTGYDEKAVAEYLGGRGVRRSWKSSTYKGMSFDDLQAWVEQRLIETPVAKIRDALDVALTPGMFRSLVVAGKFVVERKLFQWTLCQNCKKGVAPSRRQLVEQALGFISSDLPGEVKDHLARGLQSTGRSQRKWMRSWRNRWGARVGKLSVRRHLAPEVIRSKVSDLFVP
jgi:hypothetical protein